MSKTRIQPALAGFECLACGAEVAPERPDPVCPDCGQPILARYDLEQVARTLDRDRLSGSDLWRYQAVLPLVPGDDAVRLGEGGTPLLPLVSLARDHGLSQLWIKDESPNPTQSFKARGLAMAVNGARVRGRTAIALPSAGNAGSAAAAYAAAGGLGCRIVIPEDTPEPLVLEPRAFGAEVRLVPGTIADAGRVLTGWAPADTWWNVATFKEPFRAEGKKTLGWEIAEQTGWRPPDTILYPTGGGTGLIGMWRAFSEMRALGWIDAELPRLVAVQVAGCAPVKRALDAGDTQVTPWEDAATLASGLKVPSPFAGALILRALRETHGTAVAVEEDEMLDAMRTLAERGGLYACPEGGATLAALAKLRRDGFVGDGERVAIFNTGSGLKYPEAWRAALARRDAVRS